MVHKMLDTELHEFKDQGHFGGDRLKLKFPEFLEVVKVKIKYS